MYATMFNNVNKPQGSQAKLALYYSQYLENTQHTSVINTDQLVYAFNIVSL